MTTKKLTRNDRVKVIAGGKPFNSVREAFEKLKLPLGRHQRFRKSLRAAGTAVFEEGRRKVTFKIAPAVAA